MSQTPYQLEIAYVTASLYVYVQRLTLFQNSLPHLRLPGNGAFIKSSWIFPKLTSILISFLGSSQISTPPKSREFFSSAAAFFSSSLLLCRLLGELPKLSTLLIERIRQVDLLLFDLYSARLTLWSALVIRGLLFCFIFDSSEDDDRCYLMLSFLSWSHRALRPSSCDSVLYFFNFQGF